MVDVVVRLKPNVDFLSVGSHGGCWTAVLACLCWLPVCLFVFCVLQKSRTDVSNFDRQFTGERPTLTPVDSAIVENITQDEFRGFSFVNDDFGKCSVLPCAGEVQATDDASEAPPCESTT